MKNYVIQSGKFTGNGNFTGYTAKGERLFVHKAQMASVGATKDGDLKFPLFVIGDNKTINPYDDGGQPQKNADGTLVAVQRLQAMSVFLTKEALLNAHVEDATMDIEITQAVKAKATAAGLTDAQINALATSSVL